MKKKVLLVEDQEIWHLGWEKALDGKVELLHAFSLEDAQRHFAANTDLAAIAMDACVPGEEINTMPLVEQFRKTFSGPMIAVSRAHLYRKLLMTVGCDHECPKSDLPQKLLEVLGL